MVFGVMLGCVMEALSYTLDGKTFAGARALNYAVNTYLFSFNLLLPFGLLVYVDLGLYGNPGRIRKHYRPQIAVGAVMLALTVANFFVPICYYITKQNVYLDEVNRRLADYNRGENPYPLSLSYGVSFFQRGDMDAFLKEMDGRMYQMKAKHHR